MISLVKESAHFRFVFGLSRKDKFLRSRSSSQVRAKPRYQASEVCCLTALERRPRQVSLGEALAVGDTENVRLQHYI
jgi:hypothetical protein